MMPAPQIAGSLAQFAAFGAVGWVVGDALLRRAFGIEHGQPRTVGRAERALAALLGGVVFAVALMVLNLLSRGAVFGIPGVVPLFAAGVILYGWDKETLPRGLPWRGLLVVGGLVVLLYALPVWIAGSGLRSGDPPWHLGWTAELLGGEPLPVGPAPVFARNAYPWGFHAVLATLTRLVPGSDVPTALEALHLLIACGVPLAAACLARRVRRDAGWTAAFAASLIGGFGWLSARGPAFSPSPRAAAFGADMVVASPNGAYELFAPALPRELGLVLLGACGMLLALAVARAERRIGILAGLAAGVAGLVSVPVMLAGLVWAGFLGLVIGKLRRRPVLFALPVALAVFALWAGPVAAQYVRHGGFVDVTPRLGVEWPLGQALLSWGLLVPGALAGLWICRRTRTPGARTLLALALASLLLLGASLARRSFGWELLNNETLLHQGRVWPVMHLLAAALTGVALRRGYELAAQHAKALAYAGAAAVCVVGAASPVLAAAGFADMLARRDGGFVYSAPDLRSGSFVRSAASHMGPGEVLDCDEDALAFLLWQFSGVRLADYDDPRLDGNDLRIRYADLAAAWEERRAGEGFERDWLAVKESDAPPGAVPVARGTYRGEVWLLLRTT